MARHLTWCLRRTFVLTDRLNPSLQSVPMLKASDYVVPKSVAVKPAFARHEIATQEPRAFEYFVEDARASIASATATLMKILDVTKETAVKALEEHPVFKTMKKKMIYHNFQVLRECGVYKSTIKDNKFLLTSMAEDLKLKTMSIKAVELDVNEAVALYHLDVTELKSFETMAKVDASYLPARHRLFYLSEKLKCEMSKLCYLISYNRYMLSMPPPKLLTFTEHMLESGIAPEHILSDLTAYRYSHFTLRTKIQKAKDLGVHPIKPWILRCSPRFWASAAARFANRDPMLKTGISNEDLLCELTGCEMEIAKYLLQKEPRLRTMRSDKLAKNLKIVLAEGFTIDDIMVSPIAILRRPCVLEKRFAEWNAAGIIEKRLFFFGMRESAYLDAFTKRVDARKKGLNY